LRGRPGGHCHTMAPTSPPSSARMLAIYLRHHAAASRGGLDLFKRSSRSQLSPEARRQLVALADEVNEDRQRLLEILSRLDIRRPRAAEVVVGVAETLARFKPNGTLIRRSPLSDVIELEALSTAVEAKRLGWVTLRLVGERDGRLDANELDVLISRAADQQNRLEDLRRQAVAGSLVAMAGMTH
jgi:hypothetical protein